MSTLSNDIRRLVAMCRASVSITFNEHTTNYQTVEEYLNDDFLYDIDNEIVDRAECIAQQTICEVRAYTDTPMGFYRVAAPDAERAVRKMLEILEANDTDQPQEPTT